MISIKTRSDIIANRFAYTEDEEVLVNAIDLCNEIIANDRYKHELARLQNKVDILSTLIDLNPTYSRIDLRV